MSSRRNQQAAKSAGESFAAAAATSSIIFDILGSVFRIPAAIKWGVTALIGLIAGCFGGVYTYRAEERREQAHEQLRNHSLQLMADVKRELHTMRHELNEHKATTAVSVFNRNVQPTRLYRTASNNSFFKNERTQLLDAKQRIEAYCSNDFELKTSKVAK